MEGCLCTHEPRYISADLKLPDDALNHLLDVPLICVIASMLSQRFNCRGLEGHLLTRQHDVPAFFHMACRLGQMIRQREQRAFRIVTCLICPALRCNLLKGRGYCRILQQRFTTWRVHGKLRDRFGNVSLHRRRDVVEVWLRPPRMIVWV